MVDEHIFSEKAAEIMAAGRFLYEMGWVPATAGNFSSRLNHERMAVTASGKHKGQLVSEDILLADMGGRCLTDGGKPSAETLLHAVIYRNCPQAGAVLHTHSVGATVLSRMLVPSEDLVLHGYEMQKALSGNRSHEEEERVPVFANTQDMSILSEEVEVVLKSGAPLHGFLIQGHGLYTWGVDMIEARRHIEAFEFLFHCELESRRVRS